MIILKILSFVFLVFGFATVYGAKWAVGKYGLDKKAKCDFEHEMTVEELEKYKFNKALVNLKMAGMLVALPGIVLFLYSFR